MRDVKMTTSFVAPLARRDKTTIYQWFNTPECQSWLPPRTGIGESRTFTVEQAILLMIHSDLNRWGMPVPMAGRLVRQIAEVLRLHPHDTASIGFCENGASFCITDTAPGCKVDSVSRGAGAFRFALEIDVSSYRETVLAAIDAAPQVIGELEDAG